MWKTALLFAILTALGGLGLVVLGAFAQYRGVH
jgi:hypothetical protein